MKTFKIWYDNGTTLIVTAEHDDDAWELVQRSDIPKGQNGYIEEVTENGLIIIGHILPELKG